MASDAHNLGTNATISKKVLEESQKMILLHLTLLLVLEISSSAEETSGCSNCDDAKLSPEQLRDLRLEYIKGQILSKLRMKNPPNVTSQSFPNLPNLDLLTDLEDEDDPEEIFSRKDYYGKTREIVIFSKNSTLHTSPNKTNCFEFLLTSEVSTRNIKKAELWIRADAQDFNSTSATYTIFDAQLSEDDNITRSSIANVTSNDLDIPDWLKFDVTFAVRSWVASGRLQRMLYMKCDGCDNYSTVIGDPQSFLRIRVDLKDLKNTRRRSYHICSDNSTFCCKEIFNVSFDEIGWHHWIFSPTSYNANFCRGSCTSDISSARYFHTTVIRGFLQSDMATERNFMPSLCCSPYKMRSLTIIYITEDLSIYKKTLPNMVAESCDCV